MRRFSRTFVVLGTLGLLVSSAIADRGLAALLVDQAFTDINQIRCAANNPFFGSGTTQDVAAVNLTWGLSGSILDASGGAAAGGTLQGIGFHDINLSLADSRSGTSVMVANGLPGVTMDYQFAVTGDYAPRNLTSTVLAGGGPDLTVAYNVAKTNHYISTSNHRPNLLTLHGLGPYQPLYVQMIGGQHDWNKTTTIFVNGDGTTEGTGINVGTWNSNMTNRTPGLAGFQTSAKANGDLTLELQTSQFSGLAAVMVSGQQSPWLYCQTGPNGSYTPSASDLVNSGSPSLLSRTNNGGSYYGSDPGGSALNNGTIYADGATSATEGERSYCPANGSAITFDLDLANAPLGYDISAIEAITGAGGGQYRASQKMRVEYSTVGSSGFELLVGEDQWNFLETQHSREMKVGLYSPLSSPMAHHVDQLRFTFFGIVVPDLTPDGISMYREIDVSGTPTVPEPATLGLLLAGLAGLCMTRRRGRSGRG